MLRTTSVLPKSVLKWVSQVAASLGATLSATLIWSAVPHPGAAPAPQPELTTGGKFAARAVGPVAFDGLDTMPLPHVAPSPARFVAPSVEPAPSAMLHAAAWDEAAPSQAPRPVRPVRSAQRAPLRADAPRAEAVHGEPRHAEQAPHPAAAVPAQVAAEPEADGGLLKAVIPSALPRILPSIVSTARSAWTVTASAGDTLMSHVVPLIP